MVLFICTECVSCTYERGGGGGGAWTLYAQMCVLKVKKRPHFEECILLKNSLIMKGSPS